MNNLKIDAIGTFPGGTYDKVDVDGVATINGDINATELDIDGVATINGRLDCRSFSCDGTCSIHGEAGGEEMDLDGVVSFKSHVHANILTCDGTVSVGGNLRCERFRGSGILKFSGSKIEGTSIEGDGFISAKNAQISADQLNFEGRICADEIVGESIKIRSSGIRFLGLSLTSTANVIEATDIDLKGVTATSVNGHHIRLGKNCHVEQVDCSGTLYIHSSCSVGKITGQYTIVG